ncbi:MAG: beta-galactosidase [Chloroflexota bacterium]
MTQQPWPQVPYGAVYFRKSNPPHEDWERDYVTAAQDGNNIFRHWFMWSAIETAPGVYEWHDYDRQLDLAAEHGIKTVIAEMMTAAPEWAFRTYAAGRLEARDGAHAHSSISASSGTGGFPGLCLDHDDVRAAAERFLTALVTRYRGHPGLGGYDVWNECNMPAAYCYCPFTAAAFRTWLQQRYTSLEELGRTWHRYSYAQWDDVQPPRSFGGYPDSLDWLQFRIEHAYERLRWRVNLIRRLDSDHPITAHGIATGLFGLADACADEWRAAAEVDSYGFTWIAARKGNEPWKQWHAVDLVRAGSRGKPFWHAEAQAGPLWLQPQVINRPRDDGRIAEPEDIRLWNMVTFAGGASGILYPRWRPLLDGPLWGAFGAYGMDGSRTPRSAMTSKIATWANAPAQAPLFQAKPVRGEVGIVVVPESQLLTYIQHGTTNHYSRAVWGAYRAFFDANIQADWVHLDDIDGYRLLYLPFPIMLTQATSVRLATWVEAGGCLVSEGCPAYFGDHGHVGTVQPNYGLDIVFGGREQDVEFTPDILDDLTLTVFGKALRGSTYLQAYAPQGGTAVGMYADGRVAALEHPYGKGKTLLFGTMVGAGYGHAPTDESREWFRSLLAWAGVTQHVQLNDRAVTARLHRSDGGRLFLWAANPTRQPREMRLKLGGAWGAPGAARVYWGDPPVAMHGETVQFQVGARDALIMELLPAG